MGEIESKVDLIHKDVQEIKKSLTGTLAGGGLIHRVDKVEKKQNDMMKWLGVFSATILALFAKSIWSTLSIKQSIESQPVSEEASGSTKTIPSLQPAAAVGIYNAQKTEEG